MLVCFTLYWVIAISCPLFWLLQSWNLQCYWQSCYELKTIGIEGFLILFCVFLGRCLRNESLGFVPVFEFLFTGVCRREQKLEVKNCEVWQIMAENLLLSVSSSTFCGTLLTRCFGQQPTGFWTADNLCRSNIPSRGSSCWIGGIITQGERHPLYLLYASLTLKGSLGLMRYLKFTVSGYSSTGQFLFITISFCVFWSGRECGINAWWSENNMLRVLLDQ